ncbi:ABC transporter permease [Nocardioides sp.]|uniref:ABC transporter permease n=1 Tax=Nocardioides sp. TaxID=35761 RepID=UPI0035652DD4
MSSFTGTWQLTRLILRRDRIRLPIWIVSLGALTGATALLVPGLYTTPEAVAGYARVADSAATRLLSGRPDGLDNVGAITSYEVSVTGLIAIALMVIFLVVRHTRAEEEAGRAELLRATVLGRHAGTAAAMIVATAASLVLGVVDAVLLVVGDLEVAGSVLHGATFAATGLVFTAVAAVTAQITVSARSARGMAGAVLAVLFVVRGIGDVAENALTWLSPLGWALMAQPYGAARWWVLVPLVLLAAVLFLLAAWLTAHRDTGGGLLHPRPGPERARPSLSTGVGLAWRLQRGSVVGWAVGLVLFGALAGTVGPEVNEMLESNPELQQFFALTGGSPADAFLATMFALMAVAVAGYSVASVNRLHSEEAAGRAEALLSTGLSRSRWAVGSLTVTLVTTVGLMVLGALAAAIGFWLTGAESAGFGRIVAAGVVQVPGTLVLAGIAVLLTGWWPRRTLASYALVAWVFVQVYLSALLKFPDWLNALSPYDHLPLMPVEPFAAVPTFTVLALALALAVLGVMGLRRRDVA